MLQLGVRQIAGEDHSVASDVLPRQVEVFLEPSRLLQIVEIRANFAELARGASALGVALQETAMRHDLLDQIPPPMLQGVNKKLHRFAQRAMADEQETNAGIAGHDLGQRGESGLHSLRRDEPAHVEKD